MTKKIIKIFLILCIILMFFWSFGINLNEHILTYASMLITFFLAVFLGINYKRFFNTIKNIIKYTPIKYLFIFILWVLLSGIIVFHFDIGNILKLLFRVFWNYIFLWLFTLLFVLYTIPRYISLKRILKLFVGLYIFISIFGIIDYLCQIYNISIIFLIQTFLTGRIRNFIFYRAQSIFFEPSFYATFIFCFLPFILTICSSNIKISKNPILNRLIKFSLPVFAFLDLLLAQSAIYIVFTIVFLLIFYIKKFIRFILRPHIIFTSLCLIASVVILSLIFDTNLDNSENIIVKRITNVFIIKDIDELILKDQSLGTRLLSDIVALKISLQHPIAGLGQNGNYNSILAQNYLAIKLPLTVEIIEKTFLTDEGGLPANIFFGLAAQVGYVGVIFLYMLFFKTVTEIKKCLKYFDKTEQVILKGFAFVLINYIFVSFYWLVVGDLLLWLVIGILNSYILIYKTQIKKQLIFKQKMLSISNQKGNIV